MFRRLSVACFASLVLAACGSSNAAPDTTPTPAPATAPAPAPAPASSELQPLSHYLADAVSIKVWSMSSETGKKLETTLGADATKAWLAKLDLGQKADGPLVRCPSDTLYELFDAGGKALGSVGFCQDAARFDGPDGKFGGIKASRL